MKLFKFILLYLFLISSVQADTIYQLIKIPNLEIYNIKTTNNLRYLYAKQPFTIGVDNNINCFKSSKQDLDQKYQGTNPTSKWNQSTTICWTLNFCKITRIERC